MAVFVCGPIQCVHISQVELKANGVFFLCVLLMLSIDLHNGFKACRSVAGSVVQSARVLLLCSRSCVRVSGHSLLPLLIF